MLNKKKNISYFEKTSKELRKLRLFQTHTKNEKDDDDKKKIRKSSSWEKKPSASS